MGGHSEESKCWQGGEADWCEWQRLQLLQVERRGSPVTALILVVLFHVLEERLNVCAILGDRYLNVHRCNAECWCLCLWVLSWTRVKVKLLTKVDLNVRIIINCWGFLLLLTVSIFDVVIDRSWCFSFLLVKWFILSFVYSVLQPFCPFAPAGPQPLKGSLGRIHSVVNQGWSVAFALCGISSLPLSSWWKNTISRVLSIAFMTGERSSICVLTSNCSQWVFILRACCCMSGTSDRLLAQKARSQSVQGECKHVPSLFWLNYEHNTHLIMN